MMDSVINADCFSAINEINDDYVHMILSDIPYGISYEEWDVLHSNTNSALLGSSPAQEKAGSVFKSRGKPLNGWSEADKKISIEYYDWCASWAKDWLRVLKPGGSVFIFAGRRMAHRCICALEDIGFTFKDMISWEKETAPHRAQRLSVVYEKREDIVNAKKWEGWRLGNLRPVFEPILWFVKPYRLGGTIADNVIQNEVGAFNDVAWNFYSSASSNMIRVKSDKSDHGLHPAQKPLILLQALIRLSTLENQIVLDPFCGSGSTLVAAKTLNRRFIGFEKSAEYFQISIDRLNQTSKNENGSTQSNKKSENQISLF